MSSIVFGKLPYNKRDNDLRTIHYPLLNNVHIAQFPVIAGVLLFQVWSLETTLWPIVAFQKRLRGTCDPAMASQKRLSEGL